MEIELLVMTNKLVDETAIVTGAAQGIGRSIARRLGEEGASIVIADVAEEGKTTTEIFKSNDIDAKFIECNVKDREETKQLAKQTLDEFNSIDILVNNAGITSHGAFTEIDPNEWKKVIDTNLTGTFNCSHEIAPIMINDGGGRIVNISSMAGRNISYQSAAPYTASKWGLIGLTKHMAWDLGEHGIRVNAICPGTTRTSIINSRTDQEDRDLIKEKIPLNKLAQPKDQANAVLFLVSEEASFLTGTVLEVDGGKQLGIRHEI